MKLAFTVTAVTAAVFAQQAQFEAATIRPSGSTPQREVAFQIFPSGRIVATNHTLKQLMKEAFGVQLFQITGGPAWIDNDRFDLEAKPSQDSRADAEQRQMLQALLTERFQLKLRHVTEDGPVYFLERSAKPLKLRPVAHPAERPWVGGVEGGGLRGKNISMPGLAEWLSREMKRPVLDRTGVAGSHDFKFVYSPEEGGHAAASSVITSLGVLGLKLTSGKGPVDTIVVDGAAQPAGN